MIKKILRPKISERLPLIRRNAVAMRYNTQEGLTGGGKGICGWDPCSICGITQNCSQGRKDTGSHEVRPVGRGIAKAQTLTSAIAAAETHKCSEDGRSAPLAVHIFATHIVHVDVVSCRLVLLDHLPRFLLCIGDTLGCLLLSHFLSLRSGLVLLLHFSQN